MARRIWQAGPSGGTPLSAVTLNEMEDDIAKGSELANNLDLRVSELVDGSGLENPQTRDSIRAMIQRDAEVQMQDYAKELVFSFVNNGTGAMTLRTFTVENGNTLVNVTASQRYAGHNSPTHGVRDPSVKRYNGRYIMAATKALVTNYLGPTTEFQLAYSEDLITWQHLALVPSGVPNTTQCWAPDLFIDYDGKMYVYYSVSANNLGSFQTYVRRCEDTTGAVWSAPVAVQGLPSPKAIDATVDRYGDRYVVFVKDESGKQINRAWGTSPFGPFTLDKTGTWMGTGPEVEGPDLIRLPDGRYRMYYDHYEPMPGRLCYKESTDLTNWGPEVQLVYPAGETLLRHVSSMWLSQGEWNALKFQISASALAGVRRSITATRITTLACATSTGVVVPFTAQRGPDAANGSMWAVGNASRLVAPTPGWYSLEAHLSWAANTTGIRSAGYKFNGTTTLNFRVSQPANAVGGTEYNFQVHNIQMQAGEYLEVFAYQTAGASLNLAGAEATLTKTANL